MSVYLAIYKELLSYVNKVSPGKIKENKANLFFQFFKKIFVISSWIAPVPCLPPSRLNFKITSKCKLVI